MFGNEYENTLLSDHHLLDRLRQKLIFFKKSSKTMLFSKLFAKIFMKTWFVIGNNQIQYIFTIYKIKSNQM